MTLRTTLRLALVGTRSDRARITLTAAGAVIGTLTLLCAATVAAIPTGQEVRYTNALLQEDGLRPGVVLALVLLTIPALTLVAQCSRLGAPARERRLAAIRLAGAVPRQVVRLVTVETALASVPGVAAGFAVYLTGRALLDTTDARGVRSLPTDVMPHAVPMVLIALGVPALVAALTVRTLRRAALSPLTVVRATRRPRPRALPGVLIVVGLGCCAVVEPLYHWFTRHPQTNDAPSLITGALVIVGVTSVAVGVVTGTGWITYTSGRVLVRHARRPAVLLAGRRMMADPWSGSRTLSALLIALLIGSAAAGLAAFTVATVSAQEENTRRFARLAGERYVPEGTGFYERAYELVGYASLVALLIAVAGLLVALADTVLAQRRTFVSFVAAGTPRSVLSKAVCWQTLTPAVPAVLLAVLAGVLLPRLAVPSGQDTAAMQAWRCSPLPGDTMAACKDATYAEAHGAFVTAEKVPVVVHMPWAQLALLTTTALTATVLITLVGLLFLRGSTRLTELRTA
ncbi:hypothetical protein ABTZ58_24025 [Streptomyces sp. NPDC094143]|uniref:hypothetical protein n=1 Tax=Streptomyces sp. NPDC094143 TaxID=3155310 RepID=UPI00332D4EC0